MGYLFMAPYMHLIFMVQNNPPLGLEKNKEFCLVTWYITRGPPHFFIILLKSFPTDSVIIWILIVWPNWKRKHVCIQSSIFFIFYRSFSKFYHIFEKWVRQGVTTQNIYQKERKKWKVGGKRCKLKRIKESVQRGKKTQNQWYIKSVKMSM